MAGNTDKFMKVGNPGTATTLSAPGYTIGSTTVTVGSTTNWPSDTGVCFSIYETSVVAGQTVMTSGSYNEYFGVVSTGTSVISVTHVSGSGTDKNYLAGPSTIVTIMVSAGRENRLAEGLLVEHGQDGHHTAITATSVTSSGLITAPSATITSATITNLTVGSQAPSVDWTAIATPPNTVTYNGQRSYSLVFNGVDYTNIVNPGTRLRTTRTVAAPTQSTSLNGTNQYWVKTAPNKMTFTDDFVVDAYVKLTSYQQCYILSRYDGNNGFGLSLSPSGQVQVIGFNGSTVNNSHVDTYQSLPLNKWVRITGQLDMSTFTATPTTSYIMIDGIDVPCSVTRGGTNPTALVQGGTLTLGALSNATNFFPGKIAQVAVFNAKVTQATMLTYMSQGLSGTETSLASAYSFNGVATDLNTTTPNDLTAQGSAVATNADSPFGTQASGLISSTLDYAIIQSATFSTNTTLVVQVPEGCTIPTSGGVSSVSYSSMKAPYGFPADVNRWDLLVYLAASSQNNTIGALNVDTTSNIGILAPIGKWMIGMNIPVASGQGTSTGAGNNDIALLVKGDVSGKVPGMYIRANSTYGGTSVGLFLSGSQSQDIVQTAAERYTLYGNMATFTGGVASFTLFGQSQGPTVLSLKNNYL